MDKGSIVLMQQPETKVYVGETGYIVIRQDDWEGSEQVILIDPIHAQAICDAVLSLQTLASQGFEEWREAQDGK